MKVLFLGGTRFTGLKLAEYMAYSGHDVVVASRRVLDSDAPMTSILGERSKLLEKLHGKNFDVVFDFIAYNGADVLAANECINIRKYILISTTWLPRFFGFKHAATEIPENGSIFTEDLPKITQKYLTGKASAESAVHKIRKFGRKATIVRFPVMTGSGDHTKRLHFYRSRFLDGNGIIVVDDYNHDVQIATNLDLARALQIWIERHDVMKAPIWDALPPEHISWKKFLMLLAEPTNITQSLFVSSRDVIYANLPEYLEVEPLWREKKIPLSDFNIFLHTEVKVTPYRNWIAKLEPIDGSACDKKLRKQELELISRFKYKR